MEDYAHKQYFHLMKRCTRDGVQVLIIACKGGCSQRNVTLAVWSLNVVSGGPEGVGAAVGPYLDI